MSSETLETADYRCEICGQTFESEAELEEHVKDIGVIW